MKLFWSDREFKYDGSQLKPLFNYLQFGLLGDSIVAWSGACEVLTGNMVDGEDVLAGSKIASEKMLHFIVEKFNINLFSGVLLQRLLASKTIDVLQSSSPRIDLVENLVRKGDDLFIENKKLNISIASQSSTSTLIHFAVNITNLGTPVPTISLEDLEISPQVFALQLMQQFCNEIQDIERATQKVFPL